MRKLFLLGTMLGVASAALAFGGMFGGGGSGSKSTTYKGGVDAIGVHYNGEKKEAEITCPEYSTLDKSCNECKCDEGYVKNEEGDCVENQCLGLDPENDPCLDSCDPVTGDKTYAEVCPDENGENNWRCDEESHECVNPCSEESTTCFTYTAENGECTETINTGATCDTNDEHKICGESGDCSTCEDGYELVNGTCLEECEGGQERDANNVCQDPCPEGISRSTRDGTCSICDNGNVHLSYMDDPCQYPVSGCTSNDECAEGQYCKLTGYECEYPEEGVCEDIGEPNEAPLTLNDQTRAIYYIKSAKSYWAAENWCKAQGKRMPSLADFGITGGYENECTTSGCIGADWDALRSAISTSCWYWTTTYTTTCKAYSLNPRNDGSVGQIWHLNRQDGSYSGENCALCIDE